MTARERRGVLAWAFLGGLVGTMAGCQPQGPAERAGRSIDRGVQDAKDPAGPVEKVGRAVDRAVNP